MARLSKKAILVLRGLDKTAKQHIADANDPPVTIATVNRWIATNDDNLTKAGVLQVIREETGLLDSEILEEDTEKEPQS